MTTVRTLSSFVILVLGARAAAEVDENVAKERPRKGDEVTILRIPESDRRAYTVGMTGTVVADDKSDVYPFQVRLSNEKKYWYSKSWLTKKRDVGDTGTDAKRVFERSFALFAAADVAKLLDTAACARLRHLPW
eukprot:CAMPEP_0117582900 /NCGR_PEP_ID=MMETSP0784-20121206/66693_1 /TAXON_ID=39447 /ORGANISM="" /LENGTH=133 /DNA_ID=CAMNT_0005383481 /DNA_START=64 /DNA_END=462 /DNA_ORIENTATION=-